MAILEQIIVALTGALGIKVVEALRDGYNKYRDTLVANRQIESDDGDKERDISVQFAIEEREENRELRGQLAASKDAYIASLENQINSLESQVDLYKQLSDRLRLQVNDLTSRLMQQGKSVPPTEGA